MYDAVHAERLGTPTVVLANVSFANDAGSACSGKGMPGVRYVAETVPCECSVFEQTVDGVSKAIDEIIGALTRPLTTEEASPSPRRVESGGRVAFQGDLQEVNKFYYRRGWTDGWPVVPPTEAAVREMLRGTDLPPDHVVAKIIPRMGKATVEKIAINAVMAGCLPTYMPILIAAVQALVDPAAWFGTWEVSTGSWVPFYIVNGPVRHQLSVNSGSGALSPGDRANAAIGRAMGLIVKNIGGARKGIEDMGVLGNSGKYAMVIAENEEASPWEPLHVEQGFDREDSCVSVTFPNSFPQIRPVGTDEKGILRGIIMNLMPAQRALKMLMTPPAAQTLAGAGWTKKELAAYIAEYARVPAYKHGVWWRGQSADPTTLPIAAIEPAARRHTLNGDGFYLGLPPLNADDPVATIRAEQTRIIVAGGPGVFVGLFGGGGARYCVTKKAALPADWESLVRKYKDLVPNHVMY